VIIENKIWTTEHSDQLDRYHRFVKESYPDRLVRGIYLTPHSDPPSHEAYMPFSYGAICEVLDSILEERGSNASSDVRMAIQHYTNMLRRHIVGDTEIARLCQQIYQKHRRAFDLVYEHRPDVQAEIQDVIENLIRQEPRLELDFSGKSKIGFGVRDWDTPSLLTSSGWTPSGRILLFEVWNYPGSVDMKLFIGPGSEITRERLLEMVRANSEILRMPRRVNRRWIAIYSSHLLKQEDHEDLEQEEFERKIHRQWRVFLDRNLPHIEEALRKEPWIWEPVGPIPA
jgi:PD-(D/E)XK nuclease superfamily